MLPFFGQAEDDVCYHDAQISVLLTGVDEWYWTTYCIVDTFSNESENADTYFNMNCDGPSGGGRDEHFPEWNPREYFLLVLSRRFNQVAHEWDSTIQELINRLDTYVILSSRPGRGARGADCQVIGSCIL